MNRGFTLFEILLYVAILAIVAYFIGGFAFNIYNGKERISVIQDLNDNGRFMIDTMTKAIEQSTNINGTENI